MSLIEFMVVLGACLIGVLIGCLLYARHRSDQEVAAILAKALDNAVRRERERAKSEDSQAPRDW